MCNALPFYALPVPSFDVSPVSVPQVVSVCCNFIEARGIVDGVYRLSGISSNIQRLKKSFDDDKIPDLAKDRGVLQDIHSVSSLVKLYFRELPNDSTCGRLPGSGALSC